uniref:Cardiomyopathy associated 5 n=1 Tax=Podarcis muralis TaxID=64176 RepID=A0A670JQP9_PODMU
PAARRQQEAPLAKVVSLKSLNQHEEVKSDAMDAIHSEDSAQTWETSSSRCSTSQASETSATSGVYSMENSYMEGPPGKSIYLMEEGKMVQKRTRNSPFQVPLPPNEKMGPDNEKRGFSGRPTEAKALERELDPADPQSWTLQVQPSKIKNYLVQITQEAVDPLPEEKENVFMKKAELPLEGTVRAKIQLLTAALEERNKKIFRRVNNMDLPPPTVVVIRKPREPPKKFTRQAMFQASLKHLEQQATIKNNHKEILHLKRMQAMLAKTVPRSRDEERVRRSFLPEPPDKASKMVPPTSPLYTDKAKKLDTESHSPAMRMTAPEQARFASPDRHDRMEKRGKQSQLSITANAVSEKLPSLLVETEEEEEEAEAEEMQPPPLVSTKPLSQPANEAENQDDSTFSKLSESAAQDLQYPNNIAAEQFESQDSLFTEIRNPDIGFTIPSQFEIKDSGLLHSAEEAGKQDIPVCSPEPAEPVSEQAKLPPPVSEREKQEEKQLEAEYSKKEEAQEQSTTLLQAEPAHLMYPLKEWEVGEAETAPNLSSAASRTETQEPQSDSCEVAEEHIGLSQPTHFMGGAEKRENEHLEPDLAKEAVETQVSVTASLQPEQSDALHSRSEIKNQPAQPGSQWLDSSLPIPEAQREEIQQHSLAGAQSESEHPVISEPIKATQGFELLEPLHLKGNEVSAYSPAEALDSSEQLSSVSSAEKVEMLETQQPSLETVTLLSEQRCSALPYPTEKMEKKDSLPCSPETAAETAEVSLPTATFQMAEVTKVEVHPLSPTEVPSEESESISREPDVAIDRKTTQLVSPLSVEPPSKASVPPQEAAKEENQQCPPSDAKLSSEDQDEEGQQDGWFPLFATTQFEPEHSAECESTMQSIKQDSSASFPLGEATALRSVDDADKKERHPDKSITEPSLHPVFMPGKQGRMESEIEQTTHQLSCTVLPMESVSKLQSEEEMEVNEIQTHLSATGQDLSQSVYLTEPQEDQGISAAAAALESGSLSIPYTDVEAEKCDTTEPVLKEETYQAIQAVTAEMEKDYLKVSHMVSESEKHLEAPFPAQNTEEGNLQSHTFVSPESEDEHVISSEREESEFYPLLTPTPELGYPTAGSETQESQSYLSDALNEALNALNEQPSYSSSVLEDKAKIEENQTPFPETPKMAPDESLSFAAFLISEAKGEPLVSPMDTKMTPKESNSIPEDFVSEEVKEIAPPSSPLSSEQLSKEVISSYAAVEEENQDQPHSLLREESKHLDAGGADVQGGQSHLLVAAQPEARSQDIELHCPQTAQPELEDVTLLDSTEEIQKQEAPLYSPSIVPSVHEEILHHKGERENQGTVILGTEETKEEDAPLKSPVLPQELEQLRSLQSVKESQVERAQPYSSAAVQDSLQLPGETGSQEGQGYFNKPAEVDSGVSKLSELTDAVMEQEIQAPRTEAVKLERKESALSVQENEKVQDPLVTASLDLEHLGSSYSTETQSPGEPPPDASLLTEKAEEQEVRSQPASVSPASVLDQSSSASLDLIAEVEEQETKHPPKVANVMPEEPLSFAAFLFAKAKKIYTTLTSEKENLDSQPPFKEADLLIERSESISTSPPETNVTINEETELPTTHFEVEQFASKPEADVTYRDERENISETPTLSNLIPNEPSDAVIPEPINDILTHNLHSSVSSADSHTTDNKTIQISAGDFSKTEEIKCLPSADITLKEPENELKDHEKLREIAIPSVEFHQGKEISEGNKVVNIHAAPLNSSADKEEEKHMPERLEHLETAALQKRKPFHDAGDMPVDQEFSRCKISVKTSEGIEEDNHENKESKSNELVKEKGVQESVEKKKEVSIVQESYEDGGVNDNGIDHIEKHTVVDETCFIQTGNEQSFKEVQRQCEVTVENSATLPTAGTKNIIEFSSLERNLDEGFNRMAEKENTTASHEDLSKILIKDVIIGAVREKDENTEDKLNLAGEPLSNTQKDVLSQSPLISLPATTVNPELLEVPPTLAFLYKDLYEEAVEKPKEDSHKYPSNEETENTDVSAHTRGPTRDDGTGMCFERDVSKDDTPTLEESQKKQVLKDKGINEQALTLQSISKCADEPSEKKPQSLHILTEAHAETEVSSPRGTVERLDDALVDRPAEIMSDIKVGNVETCQPTHAVPFGSGLFGSGASNDDSSQRSAEESMPEETGQALPEETSDEESCPILDYAASVFENAISVQDESEEVASSDIDEDLAELMDYEMVSRDDVFEEETSSEVVHEELMFDDRKSSDRISDSYEFVNEREANTYAEEEEFQLTGLDKLPRNVPETEVLQKESDHELLDSYCRQCKCPISAEDKLSGEHKEHTVTNLDIAVTELKSQLDGFLDVLQERSLKIEGFVSEIEALFNSLEENCKEKEQLLDEQNESIIKTVIGHHDRKQQSFEEVKNAKMDYLYEQMVNFQEYIDTAKDTLEAILKETEEMDDFVFLSSSEEINKRLLSAVENILAVEKIPPAFSQFEHFASGSANGNQTLKHMPVPQTPKLQPQDPNSATSTSIAVYWTVNEDDVIDFFQVYCMEECPGNREQSGLVEEYRVTVKESNCILEDLEPGHSYSVWVMAVNYSGCSFPSGKSTFRTAPPSPVIKAEECSVCWDAATIRWSTSNPEATDSFTLEYCRQYSPEGEGLRSLAGIKRPEMKVHLESNVNYFFYVRAINIFGTSEQSEAALISTRGTRFHIMKETAAPALQVSPSGTMICLPEETEATGISPVLGELLSARGWHYWETTVSGCSAYKVGICYSTMPQDSILGQNNASWCLHCPSKTSFLYKVLHRGEMSDVIVTEQPPRIGILLNYNAGRLLFFNAERGQLLFAILQKFTDAAHPAFVLEEPGVLHLHTGMELPEFVKQS